MPDSSTRGDVILTVNAPGQFANAQLNGTACVIVRTEHVAHPGAVEVLLLDGPNAHRSWWLLRDHLTPEKSHAR